MRTKDGGVLSEENRDCEEQAKRGAIRPLADFELFTH